MKPQGRLLACTLATALLLTLTFGLSSARPPIKADFFSLYPGADGTQLTDLPSNTKHCGVCHFAFDGAGRRNPYGVAIEALIQLGLSNTNAMIAVQDLDSDGDGYTNLEEVTNSVFSNTPTFPGLSSTNLGWAFEVTPSEVDPYLTPDGSSDTIDPAVTLLTPNGGNVLAGGTFSTATYTASDASGIAYMELYYSDDGGSTFKKLVDRAPDTGSISFFVPNLPSTQGIIRIEAVDNAGNEAADDSDAVLTVTAQAGRAPTTIQDMFLPGTQPFEGAILENPETHCRGCHGDYDTAVEPFATWQGSMMAQAARDPLFLACVTVAEQDAPSVGDLCIRCHSPGGWQEGRSIDTSGSMLNAKDRQGVQCAFCHRMVDRNYVMGVSPPEDVDVLAALSALPLQYANGQFINDPSPLYRGPFPEDTPTHQFAQSDFTKSSDLCGTCHDVSNPVYEKVGPRDYALTAFGEEHPTMALEDMFPIERTYSEWSNSEYASTGVFAPQFAGNKLDGIVSTCQDCHMRDVAGAGSNQGSPTRDDLPLHDLMGANAFIPDIIPDFFPGEVDTVALNAAKARAISMLQLAATLDVSPRPYGIEVRVTNEGAHKLPSGYPEGRRIWINVVGRDGGNNVVFESGGYNFATGELTHDEQLKVYEVQPGLSPAVAAAINLPPGKSFHFVLNDTIYLDNRIPPRGFTNAAFETIQSPPIGYSYADGQYWDDTEYFLPEEVTTATVTVYYQTTTKEYVEFLRDENVTNSAGQDLYNAWVAHGRGAPVVMAQTTVSTSVTGVEDTDSRYRVFQLLPAQPNPFSNRTRIQFEIPRKQHVSLDLFDVSGRRVRTLVDEDLEAKLHRLEWDGRNDQGADLSAGLYFMRLRAGAEAKTERIILVR